MVLIHCVNHIISESNIKKIYKEFQSAEESYKDETQCPEKCDYLTGES